MNYIYDVLLNFQKDFYEFFEWNRNDEIYHIRKMPLFRVSSSDFNLFRNGVVCFDKEFLDSIFNRCERIKKVSVSSIAYAFLVSDGKDVMALKLNKKGINIFKSGLLIDEADDIADIASDLRERKIGYSVIKKEFCVNFQTRFEIENCKRLIKNLENIYCSGENDKIRYLYLECFNENSSDVHYMYDKLRKEILEFGDNYLKIFDFFKIISAK